jgi:RHS repeat-associated protein
MKKLARIIFFLTLGSVVKISAQTMTTGKNAIMEKTPREPMTTVVGATHTTVQTAIQYFDGLGRATQTVIYKGSANANQDMVSSTTQYDAFGRANKNILSTPSNVATGAFQLSGQSLATNFYENDANPFTETVFEPSPLNRPQQQYGAGQAWRTGAGYAVQQAYLTAGTEVLHLEIRSTGSVEKVGTYGSNTLFCHRTTSERGFQTNEYKDRLGRVLAKSQEQTAGVFAVTLYVYDDLNRLRYVIPPEAYQSLNAVSSFTEADVLFMEGIYGYHYDTRGRLAEKHIPGGGWSYLVYDKNDRVVMHADDQDKANNYWQFSQYDILGRVVKTGLIQNIGSFSRTQIQTDFDNYTGQSYETRTAQNYTNVSFPSAYTPAEVNTRTITYYDDYTWQTDADYEFKATQAFDNQANTKTLVTGTLVRNLETNDWYKLVNYYDYKARNIQTFAQNHVGGIDRMDYQYRFNGEVLKMRISHQKTGAADITEIYDYEYDHLGRKTAFKHTYNGTLKNVAKYEYDPIGRLNAKKLSPSNSIGSVASGSWNSTNTWQNNLIPSINDYIRINAGHTVTINSGEAGSAGGLFNAGTLNTHGRLDLGVLPPTTSGASDLQTIDYKYHIRGGLRGINLDASNNLSNALFSFKLGYEDAGFYDGNIGRQEWKSSMDGIKRSYQYAYDGDSRLTGATYESDKATENYGMSDVSYDRNGNIKTLSRSGATNANYTSFGNVDNLTYTYQSNSNKLLKVTDATTTNADLGDFRNGTNTGDDYEYWADGSLKKDLNKNITQIQYNYLKLPKRIEFSNETWINYQYDASGKKLQKVTSQGITTDYVANKIYENNVLYQTTHDEGRINAQGVYEYNITDHNNDLRIAFKDSAGIATPTQSIFYDPWGLSMKGMQIAKNPANFNKYQFLNRETQFETGYIDLIRRQYDPQIGRFISQDPVTDGQEHLSLYQYGWNNPILKPDPNGDCPLCPVLPFIPEIGAGLIAAGEAITGLFVGGATGTAIGVGVSGMSDSKAFIPYSVQLVAHKVEKDMAKKNDSKSSKVSTESNNKKEKVKIEVDEKNKIDRNELDPPKKPGNAPTFKKDGSSVEIHHEGQKAKGPFKEMHPKDHRMGDNYKKNHPSGQKPLTKQERKEFNKSKAEYWKSEYPKQ